MVKAGVAGNSTKSPCSNRIAGAPSTASRQVPSVMAQKPGWWNAG
tara:strand:+ start:463 stop:597 length:135 start_codon:yes stop_codon:yes gene_type:complete